MAVERMKQCDHIGNLARELGVNRCQLYYWRRQAEPVGARRPSTPVMPRQTALERQNEQLKKALAEKVLEVDFFKGALQKIEARRQSKSGSGATASTTTSGT
jgi:transposase-like protein